MKLPFTDAGTDTTARAAAAAAQADADAAALVAAAAQSTSNTHASRHVGGADAIAVATTSTAGLESAADKTKLDGIEALADVTSAGRVLTALAAAAGDVSVNSHKLTNVQDPSSAQDAVTKAYFDANRAAVNLGGRLPLYVPPSTPHAYDHEFDSTTAPSDFELYNQGGSPAVLTFSGTPDFYDATLTSGSAARAAYHTNARRSHARIQMPSVNTDNVYAFKPGSALPTNCFIWGSADTPSRWAAGAGGDGNLMLGLFKDTSSHPDINNSVVIGYGNLGTNQRQGRYMSFASGSLTVLSTSSGDIDTGVGHPWEYFGIQKIGTTYHGWSFNEGGLKQHWGSITYATTLLWLGWYVRCADAAAPGQTIFEFDFLRFISGIAMPG